MISRAVSPKKSPAKKENINNLYQTNNIKNLMSLKKYTELNKEKLTNLVENVENNKK